jgi:hypothetical protein
MVYDISTLFSKKCSDNKCFWTEKLSLLFSTNVVPLPNKNYIYNLNAVSRCLFIFIIFSYFFIKKKIYIILSIIGLIICYILYKILNLNLEKENFKVFDKAYNTEKNVDDDNNLITTNQKNINYDNLEFNYDDLHDLKNLDYETPKNIRKFKFYNDRERNNNNNYYNDIFNVPYEKQLYNHEKKEPLKENKEVQFYNLSDAYSYNINQRFDIPRIDQDNDLFARWLFSGFPNCKTDQYQCLKNKEPNLKTKTLI